MREAAEMGGFCAAIESFTLYVAHIINDFLDLCPLPDLNFLLPPKS